MKRLLLIVAVLMIICTACTAPISEETGAEEVFETDPDTSEYSINPEYNILQSQSESEDLTSLGSYITASTDPPVHFNVEATREETKTAAQAVLPVYQTMTIKLL